MAKQISSTQLCCFWSEERKRCTANTKGLYIPYESHIAVFCLGSKFPLCRRFREEMQLLEDGPSAGRNNRREHDRSKSRHFVTLRYVDHSGSVLRHSSAKAYMIDYSEGGVQVTCRQPLFSDTVVRIIYDRSAPSTRKEQLAMVRWCRYHRDTLHYSAGLSFASSGKNDARLRTGHGPTDPLARQKRRRGEG